MGSDLNFYISFISLFLGEELYELSLVKGQILAAFPGAVPSSKKFFLHIEPEVAQVIGGKIKELVEIPEVSMAGIMYVFERKSLRN